MENKELHSTKIAAGKRTYFLDIKESREGFKYLVISESQKDSNGDYKHNRVMIFQEYFPEFYESLQKLAPELGVNIENDSYIDEIRKIYPKAYTSWTLEEDMKLVQLKNEGKSTKELSEIFQRNAGAITSRLKKLEL